MADITSRKRSYIVTLS